MNRRWLWLAVGTVLSGVACGAGARSEVEATPAGVEAREVFVAAGCQGCHVTAGESVAPSLRGLYGREVRTDDGKIVVADEAYLRESILSPAERIVAGYPAIMPEFSGVLSDAQVEALVAYIRSLGP